MKVHGHTSSGLNTRTWLTWKRMKQDRKQMRTPLEQLITNLQSIARNNGDEFRYRIDIEQARSGLNFSFVCEETADRHTWLSGDGASVEEAVADAAKNVADALEEWGYDPA